MTWQGDPRTSTAAWRTTRRRILQRDHWTCHTCHQPTATEVDHITPVANGGTDTDTNLAAICQPCHKRKTAAEGNQAAARARARTQRPAAPHPGELRPPSPSRGGG